MDLEKRKRFIINCLYVLLVGAIVIVVFRYVIFWLMPFVLGFGVAFLLKPLVNLLAKVLHLPRKPVAALCTLLFYGTAGVLIALGIFELVMTVRGMVEQIPYLYRSQLEPAMLQIFNDLSVQAVQWDPQLLSVINDVGRSLLEQLGAFVSGLSKGIIGFASGVAVSVPGIFISVIFTIISSLFISMDYYKITGFIVRQFNEKNQGLIFDIKNYVVGSVFKFITSYALLMSITFCELTVGLSILKVENAPVLAALIAMLDVLPVLGTGGVVVPWIIIEMILGDYQLAAGLLMLYLFITIVRNVLEPKVVGTRIGLHPVLMLLSMFVGAKLFGALGIVMLPFIMIVVKKLNESGKIHIFK